MKGRVIKKRTTQIKRGIIVIILLVFLIPSSVSWADALSKERIVLDAQRNAAPLRTDCLSDGEILDGAGIRIGVIDTGVMETYAGLLNAQIENGRNYVFPEQGRGDKIGHGTRVTSLILGTESVQGSAPGAIVVPLVYQSRYPSGVIKNGGTALLAQAMRDAIDVYQCRILCISSGTVIDDALLRAAAAYAEEKGVVVVAAVGNDYGKQPDRTYYPAGYESVIGVGAADEEGKVAAFSQRRGVFTVEDGVKIKALTLDGTVKEFSGTSYSAARVAGVVATLFSAVPNSSPAQIRNAIALSASDEGQPGYDSTYGWGRINQEAALELLKTHSLSSVGFQ